jgi:hypothetical protein
VIYAPLTPHGITVVRAPGITDIGETLWHKGCAGGWYARLLTGRGWRFTANISCAHDPPYRSEDWVMCWPPSACKVRAIEQSIWPTWLQVERSL